MSLFVGTLKCSFVILLSEDPFFHLKSVEAVTIDCSFTFQSFEGKCKLEMLSGQVSVRTPLPGLLTAVFVCLHQVASILRKKYFLPPYKDLHLTHQNPAHMTASPPTSPPNTITLARRISREKYSGDTTSHSQHSLSPNSSQNPKKPLLSRLQHNPP